MLPKGPGAIGKPLARSAERESLPCGFPELPVKSLLSRLLYPMSDKKDAVPKGPGAIGKPLVMPAGMKPLPKCFSRVLREAKRFGSG